MSVTGVVVAGTIGSWVGASVMYWVSRLLGRPLLIRYGRYVMITEEKIRRAEAWSSHYGTVGVFVSRLLPVIRHLIGIPAGIVRLNFWCTRSPRWPVRRCGARTRLGRRHRGPGPEVLAGSVHRISLWVGGLMLAIGALYYFFVHRHMRR